MIISRKHFVGTSGLLWVIIMGPKKKNAKSYIFQGSLESPAWTPLVPLYGPPLDRGEGS